MVLDGKSFDDRPGVEIGVGKLWAAVVDAVSIGVFRLEKPLYLPNWIPKQGCLASGWNRHDDQILGVVDVAQVEVELMLQVNVALRWRSDETSEVRGRKRISLGILTLSSRRAASESNPKEVALVVWDASSHRGIK